MAKYRFNKATGEVESSVEQVDPPSNANIFGSFARVQLWHNDRRAFLQSLFPTPRSPRNGQYRRTPPSPYRNPAQRANPSDQGAGLTQADSYTRAGLPHATWTTVDLSDATWTITIPEPKPIPYAGIRTGELIGYRVWRVIRYTERLVAEAKLHEGFRLKSWACKYLWQPGQVVEGDTEAIVSNSSWYPIFGGVYSFKTAALDPIMCAELEHLRMAALFPCGYTPYAIGTISLWGDVVEHEHGYRASHARLRSIDSSFGLKVEDLRREYGLE